jgi:hypothetical protein
MIGGYQLDDIVGGLGLLLVFISIFYAEWRRMFLISEEDLARDKYIPLRIYFIHDWRKLPKREGRIAFSLLGTGVLILLIAEFLIG